MCCALDRRSQTEQRPSGNCNVCIALMCDPVFVTCALGPGAVRPCGLSVQARLSWCRKATRYLTQWSFCKGCAMSWPAASARTIPFTSTPSGALRRAAHSGRVCCQVPRSSTANQQFFLLNNWAYPPHTLYPVVFVPQACYQVDLFSRFLMTSHSPTPCALGAPAVCC